MSKTWKVYLHYNGPEVSRFITVDVPISDKLHSSLFLLDGVLGTFRLTDLFAVKSCSHDSFFCSLMQVINFLL